MRTQKGAALIVVLSLLTVSLMVGLSSIQSSQIDERLAGNYKAAAEAQMVAEHGAAFGVSQLNMDAGFFAEYLSDELCDDLAGLDVSEEKRQEKGWYDLPSDQLLAGREAGIIGCDHDGRPLYLSWGRVVGGGKLMAERFVLFTGAVDGSYDGPSVRSPLICANTSCGWQESSIDAYLDARPHWLPDNFVCSGDYCKTSPGLGSEEGQKFGYGESDWLEYIDKLVVDESYESGPGESIGLSQGERGEWQVAEVLPGSSAASSGSTNTHGLIVVRSGASFAGSGTGHHEGLVIVESGGSVSFGDTFNVYGSVVALGDVNISVENGETGGVRYSDFFVGNMTWRPL